MKNLIDKKYRKIIAKSIEREIEKMAQGVEEAEYYTLEFLEELSGGLRKKGIAGIDGDGFTLRVK